MPGRCRPSATVSLAIFLVIDLVPSALLVISGWRLMRHEEVVAAQELRSHREQMASEVVTVLTQRIEAVRAQLRDADSNLTLASDRTDFVFAVFTISTWPRNSGTASNVDVVAELRLIYLGRS